MKFYYFIFFFCVTPSFYAQVGIGTTDPSPASILEINSKLNANNYAGFMPPRVTVSQRDSIHAMENDIGLLVFVNDPESEIYCYQVWNGKSWENVKCLSTSKSPTEVQYTVVAREQSETSGAVDLEFTIANPSPINDVTITISASSYEDLIETTAQQVNIPSGAQSFDAPAVFNIKDDNLTEGNETVPLSIVSINGGSGASTIGSNNIFNLSIVDNDVNLWINEIHYDNDGDDEYERVEIAGTAGIDLSGYRILHYNGSGGSLIPASNIDVTGSIPDQQAGFGTKNFFTTLQNGSGDALALVDPADNVIQFLSYEGTVVATEGPADGMTSVDIGVTESNASTPVGQSLQLQGTGNTYTDFTWAENIDDTIGEINVDQIFN